MRKKIAFFILLAFQVTASNFVFAEDDENGGKIRVNFSALDLATVARQVERVTKRSFLFDDNLLRNMKASLQLDAPISPLEFYRVFQTICQMNDLQLLPVEGAGANLEKIIRSQAAFKEPGVHPILARGEALPETDALISYLAKLEHASASKVMAALTPSLSASGSILQVPNTELILINDVASSVKRLQKILSLVDTPSEPMLTLAMPITNIPIEKASAQLSEYMQAIAKLGTGEAGKDRIAVIKDERLNRLHLIGPEKDVRQAEAFLKNIDLDSPAARRTIRYYKLNNVPVKEIVDYVSQLLGIALSTRAAEQQPAGAAVADATGAARQPAQTPPSTTPVARLIDTTRKVTNQLLADIVPVDGLNTLVVAGDEAVHREVAAILKNLDKRKGQVLIEVAIVQVTGDNGLELGVEGLGLNDINGGRKQVDYGTGFGIGKESDAGKRGFPTETLLGSVAGSAFRFVKDDRLQVVLSALASKSNVAIVSQPLLLINDNEEGSFTTKVSEPTTTTSQGTATTNTSFSGFADATTSLKITPHISPDGYLNLTIVQTFEEFTGGSSAAGIPPPKVSNDASTKITIPDRQTIVIGGFSRDTSSDSRSGVPGLMNIPGLGKLFSRESKRKTASRLYLFVRPKILTTDGFADLEQESDVKKSDVKRLSKNSNIKNEINERVGESSGEAEVVDPDGK